jgi:hypothetical protein
MLQVLEVKRSIGRFEVLVGPLTMSLLVEGYHVDLRAYPRELAETAEGCLSGYIKSGSGVINAYGGRIFFTVGKDAPEISGEVEVFKLLFDPRTSENAETGLTYEVALTREELRSLQKILINFWTC